MIEDPALDPRAVEVHLQAAPRGSHVRLPIATDSPRRARRMAEALRPVTRLDDRRGLEIVPLKGRADGLRDGSATPATLAVAAFITGHLGSPTVTEQTFAPNDPDLPIALAAPGGGSAQSEVPVFVVTDDPEGAPEPVALVAALRAQG
jgi:hypothetical protein